MFDVPDNAADTIPQIQKWIKAFADVLDREYDVSLQPKIVVEFNPYLRSALGISTVGTGAGMRASNKLSPGAVRLAKMFPFERCSLIAFSSSMWKLACKEVRVEIIAHELGHSYAGLIYREMGHDQYWRSIMRTLNMSDEVFHHIIKKPKTCLICDKCGHVHAASQQLMTRRLNAGVSSHCTKCGTQIRMYYKD